MLREEGDNVFQLCHIGRQVSKSSINNIQHQAWLTTYSHLAVINRVEMPKRINSSRLSPTSSEAYHPLPRNRALTMADGS
jgi:hypothetical protein